MVTRRQTGLWLALIGLLLAGVRVAATPGPPSSDEQLLIYTINRARHNPAQYQTDFALSVDLSSVAPQPPLAVNKSLVGSAEFHAGEMAQYNYFGHQSQVTGKWPNKMARENGYNLPSFYPDDQNNIESIAGGPANVLAALKGLIEDTGHDPPGHRIQLLAMNQFFQTHREIGAGFATNPCSTYRNYYSIQTASVDPGNTFLTGVVFDDVNGNGRYDRGEGMGGVTVSLGSQTTVTNAAGGWALPAPAGSYTVTASGGGLSPAAAANAVITSSNVEVDFISGEPQGIVNFEGGATGFSISGKVTVAGAPAPDVKIDRGGSSTTTVRDGTYSFSGLAAGSYTLTPSGGGFTFTPEKQVVKLGPSKAGVDFTASAAPTVQSVTLPAAIRGGKSAKGSVTLSSAVAKTTKLKVTSGNPAVLPAPTISVRKGKSTGSFKIKAKKVSVATPVTLTVAVGSEAGKSVTVTVSP